MLTEVKTAREWKRELTTRKMVRSMQVSDMKLAAAALRVAKVVHTLGKKSEIAAAIIEKLKIPSRQCNLDGFHGRGANGRGGGGGAGGAGGAGGGGWRCGKY